MTDQNPQLSNDEPLIPFSRLGGFIRQITHDVRNGLNAIDLEAALIVEIAADEETAGEAKKLRGMVSSVTKSLQLLSSRFAEVRLNNIIPCPVSDFVETFRDRIAQQFPNYLAEMTWKTEETRGSVEVDFELVITALSELVRNAFQFRAGKDPVEFSAWTNGDSTVFEIQSATAAKADHAETWGREPLVSTRRGGYGLGLFHARRIIEAHGGTLETAHDAATGAVTARVSLLEKPASSGS
jgi:signal transduction histidine kinase